MKITYPNYSNSIMNVTNSILNHYNVETNYPGIKELNTVLDKNYKHIFLVLLDGMGVNLLNEHLDKNDFLVKNMKTEITSVFPPTTVAATNSVLSGLPPISTGYLGWTQYFKKEDVSATVFMNTDYYNPKNIIEENLSEKYLSYDSILDKIKKANPNVDVEELFPSFRVNGYNSFKEQIDRAVEISSKKTKSFTYIYWTNPDQTEHIHGISSKETKSMMQSLNSEVEEFINKLNNDSLVICIADHGLVDVEEIFVLKNEKLMDTLLRKPTIEPRACNFFVKEDRKDDFLEIFSKDYGDKFLLLSKEELYLEKLLGVGTAHPLMDDFLGDYMAISIDKYILTMNDEPFFKGHHAGLTKGEMMVPLIIVEKK